jgi:hypothetical protein
MRLIPLTQGKFAIIDDEDFEEISKYKWFALHQRNTWYARRSISKKNKESMHRFILKPELDLEVDHINGNGLDNRRSNIRIVTRRQNAQNKHILKRSPLLGVSLDSRCGLWQSKICIHGKSTFLGSYGTQEEANERYLLELKKGV